MIEFGSLAPVMSFDEIAAEIGCTRQAAHEAYKRGMRKLRAADWTPALRLLSDDARNEIETPTIRWRGRFPQPDPRRAAYPPTTMGLRTFRRDHGLCIRCGHPMGEVTGDQHFSCRLKHNASDRKSWHHRLGQRRQQTGGAA